jgi:pyrroline-5-carboxylate reductase
MAEAMIRGLLDQDAIAPDRILASDPSSERRNALANGYGVRVTDDNAQAAHEAGIVVLAVKPQTLSVVLPDLYGSFAIGNLLLSIVAGAPIKRLAAATGHDAVVRSMPNTPAQIGHGITVWTATHAVTPPQLAQAAAILRSLGDDVHVDNESYLDMATALSGSGPGYVFLFMEAMVDAGVHMGFPRRIAEQLVFQTIRGSVEYAEQSGKHVAELRNQVTSPGGTTAAALYHMEKGGLRTVLSRGIWAAYERSVEFGQEDPD